MVRRVIPAEIDRRVREAARHRCGYCLSPQRLVMARLEVEHTIPLAKGGTDDETNLWLACPICNGHKSDKTMAIDPDTRTTVPLFNPRTHVWAEHFAWSDDGILINRISSNPSQLCVRHSGSVSMRRLSLDGSSLTYSVMHRAQTCS